MNLGKHQRRAIVNRLRYLQWQLHNRKLYSQSVRVFLTAQLIHDLFKERRGLKHQVAALVNMSIESTDRQNVSIKLENFDMLRELQKAEKAALEGRLTPRNEVVCTGCNEIATTKDDAGHPLCKDCYDDLDPEAKGE